MNGWDHLDDAERAMIARLSAGSASLINDIIVLADTRGSTPLEDQEIACIFARRAELRFANKWSTGDE
jgi:hypothetical protein